MAENAPPHPAQPQSVSLAARAAAVAAAAAAAAAGVVVGSRPAHHNANNPTAVNHHPPSPSKMTSPPLVVEGTISQPPIPTHAPRSGLLEQTHEQQQHLAHEALPPAPPAGFSEPSDLQNNTQHIVQDRPVVQPAAASAPAAAAGPMAAAPQVPLVGAEASSSSSAAPPPLPQPSQMASIIQSSLHWVYSISTPETFDADGNPRNRRKRRRTTDEEVAALEAAYRLDPQMPPLEREKLARSLSMPPKSVQIWFQNRRQTAKKNQDGTWNGIGKWQRTPYKVVGNYKVVGPEHVATQPPAPPTDPVVDAVHALVSLSQGNQEDGKGGGNGQGEGEAAGEEKATGGTPTAARGGKRGGRGGRTTRAAGSNKRKSRGGDETDAASAESTGQNIAAAGVPASGESPSVHKPTDASVNESIPTLDTILADSAAMDEDEEHNTGATTGDGGANATEQGVQQLLSTTPPLVPLQVSHSMVEALMSAGGEHETAGIISPSLLTTGVGAGVAHTPVGDKSAGLHTLHALGEIPARLSSHIGNVSSTAHPNEFFNFSGYAADVEAAADANSNNHGGSGAGSNNARDIAAGAAGQPQPSQSGTTLRRQ
ncbi:hypothetical protein HDU86_005211 [Geranomyces michiganensis]|nr:hypothetical protein HDU86_005211 [Geranomyces michiganensis]